MKKIVATSLIIFLFLAGCSKPSMDKYSHEDLEGVKVEGYYFPTDEELNKMRDDKMTNPSILNEDKELILGDKDTDKLIKYIQNPPSDYDLTMMKNMQNKDRSYNVTKVHHYWKYPELHQVFPNPKVKAINGSYVNNVVGKAWDYLGTPYEYGSDRTTPHTFDCSDFVRWVHLYTLGMDLPKNSTSQYEYVKRFAKRHYTDISQAKRGDILFFMSYKGWQEKDYNGIDVKSQTVAHNGIYAGNDIVIHTASQKTGGVRFDEITNSHLEYRFVGGASLF